MKCTFRLVFASLVIAAATPFLPSVAVLAQSASSTPHADEIRALQASIATAPAQADAATWLRLAVYCQDAARYTESEQAYRKAISLLKSSDQAGLAIALDHMGTMYAETGRLDKAEPLEQRALEIRQSLNDSTAIGTTYMHLAVLYLAKHDPATAETDAEMAVSLIAPTQPHPLTSASPTPEQQMAALINLSLVRCARRSCATAIPQLTRALALAQANYQPSSVPVGFIHFLLGYANWKSGNPTAAAQLMKAGTSELESQLGWGHPTYIAALKQYQGFLTQSGDTAEALEVGARLAAFNRSHQGQPSSPARASLSLDQLP